MGALWVAVEMGGEPLETFALLRLKNGRDLVLPAPS
mgnify:CR=1 FL=1